MGCFLWCQNKLFLFFWRLLIKKNAYHNISFDGLFSIQKHVVFQLSIFIYLFIYIQAHTWVMPIAASWIE